LRPADSSHEPQPKLENHCVAQKYPPVRRQQTIELWFHLLSDIFDDEQLTKEFQNKLKGILEIEMNPKDLIVSHLPERHIGRIQKWKQRSKWEFRINTHITDYKINDVMLDLRSNINILPKETWEAMGKPKLVYFPLNFIWTIKIVSTLLVGCNMLK
jgi:hypothetical protein